MKPVLSVRGSRHGQRSLRGGRRGVLRGVRGPAMRGLPEACPRVKEGRITRRSSGPAPPAADRQR
jgi:hypothetical protein